MRQWPDFLCFRIWVTVIFWLGIFHQNVCTQNPSYIHIELQYVSLQLWTMLYGGSHICYSATNNIELIILCSTYTTLNDTLNQRIPQYCQEYNDTHQCSHNECTNNGLYRVHCIIFCCLSIWLCCNCKSKVRVILHIN